VSALVAGLALMAAAFSTSGAAQADYRDATISLPRAASGTPGLGPHFPYVQQILIGGVIPLKDKAIINRTPNGWLYRAGQQNSQLTVTMVQGRSAYRLQFVDTSTQSWLWLPKRCHRLEVPQGVSASCRVNPRFTVQQPMLVEIWPRLGDDTVDTSALPALFDVSILGDDGDDVAYLGAGNDFFNGAQGSDTVHGGDGRDWLRTGLEDDSIDGGPGNDYLVGVDGDDALDGGQGDDKIYGSDGNDHHFSGPGDDYVSCGDGFDTAVYKNTDHAVSCETLHLS
jgi:hypothetical protein